MKKFVLAFALVASGALVAVPAQAGGLFGNGGLIRGSVGNWLDENVEHPITTPMAREGAVVAGQAVGTYFGGALGGVAGTCAGHTVNGIFAGQQGVTCVPTVPTFPNPVPNREWQQQSVGYHCQTPYGVAGPGQPLPLGANCSVQTSWGETHFGRIIP